MDKRNIYLITSCKGGVGKSTVAVNLAFTLALLGKKVMLADCDTKNRTVDLFLGYEDPGLFDLLDVAEKRVLPTEAVLRDPRCENLYYCTVPPSGEKIEPAAAAKAAIECACAAEVDYLFLDTSGGIEFPLSVYLDTVYEAIIVSTPSSPALRAAAKTASRLSDCGVKNLSLIINSYRGKNERALTLSVNEMIDETRVPLLGIVPYDEKMKRGQERGKPASTVLGCESPNAFYNIAMRLLGHDIPLLHNVSAKKAAK